MTNIIGWVSPSINTQPSVYDGISNPEQEKKWASELSECLYRHTNKVFHKSDLARDILRYDVKPYRRPTGEKFSLQNIIEWRDSRMVSEITVGAQDVYISTVLRGGREQLGGGTRGNIKEWSKQSRTRCERHIRNVEEGSIKVFLTLTYPREFPTDGGVVKRDLATMIKRLKRMGVKGGIWFLEFQRRGAPHVHAFLGQWPSGGVKAVANAWHEVVGTSDKRHLDFHLGKSSGRPCLEMMRSPHAASYYACKYAVKPEQKDVPEDYLNVGRFWGYWGALKPLYAVYYARGVGAAKSAVDMIRIWKLVKFGGVVGEGLSLYSATLRGCGEVSLSSLMQSTGWCPDG